MPSLQRRFLKEVNRSQLAVGSTDRSGEWRVTSGERGGEKLGAPEDGKVKMENGEGCVAQSVPIWEELPPPPGSFVKILKTQGLEHTELGRMYVKLEDKEGAYPPPPVFPQGCDSIEVKG